MKKQFFRPLLAAVLVGILAGAPATPIFAQEPAAQTPAPQPAAQGQAPLLPRPELKPAVQGGAPVSLGLSKYDFTKGPSYFPNIIKPYTSQFVAPPELANSPRLQQLIHDGKLELSLQDAIALSLENSMDIVVQRYTPWMADASVLKTKAGGFGFGVPGSLSVGSTANLPVFSFDPILSSNFSWNYNLIPVNNPFLSGTGASGTGALTGLPTHASIYNTQYYQGFVTGTSVTAFWDNTRSSSGSEFNFFNPSVQSTIGVSITQQLLQGFGPSVNKRNILIAENNSKIADLAFAQQAITTVTNTITAYWELLYAIENVRVQQQAVQVSDKLYNDNRKQLEIGTMAPLDVTRAESELATDRQNLIVAQTTKLQNELVLKNYISKDPLASDLIHIEIVPTDKPDAPSTIETATFEDAIKEAFAKRPDVQEQYYNVKNGEIDVSATKNALLPLLSLTASYASTGLAGNAPITGDPVTLASSPVVDANGLPVTVLNSNGIGIPIYTPTTTSPVTGISKQGLPDSLSQVFHNRFGDYTVGVNLSLPIRNRSAQADNMHAQLTARQLEAQLQQIKNSALLDVRNTTITVEQNKARVDAAVKARELQQQTFDAEDKKYRLGASTVYNVILTQRDLITAQGTELRARADLAESKANYERALGRTLDVNSVTVASVKSGTIPQDTRIPGTKDGQVVGVDKLLKALDQANTSAGQK